MSSRPGLNCPCLLPSSSATVSLGAHCDLRPGCCPMVKRRVPPGSPNEPSDPAIRAVTEKVLSLFAERSAVFKIDPGSEDFWRLMSYAFAFEHIFLRSAGRQPNAKTRNPNAGHLARKNYCSKALGKWWLAAIRSTVRSKRSPTAFPVAKASNEILRSEKVGTRGHTRRDSRRHSSQLRDTSTPANGRRRISRSGGQVLRIL